MLKNKETNDWATESHDIAENFAFKNAEEGKDVSEEYMKGARQIINKRIAIGGYRLADLLIKIYDDYMAAQ
jgi:GH25 family lysozyme M1 (1,4-beta-N-acetylmuramidase)